MPGSVSPFAHSFAGDLSSCILLNQYLAKQCVYKIPTNRHNLLGTNHLQHQISTYPTMQRCKSPDREDPVSPSNAAGEALAAHAQEVKKCTKFHQISGVIHAKDVRTSVYMCLNYLIYLCLVKRNICQGVSTYGNMTPKSCFSCKRCQDITKESKEVCIYVPRVSLYN